jgi:pimeloyl-ACP methyl ester carboxylesterase
LSAYQRTMEPWPGLAPYARRVILPRSQVDLHVVDSGAQGQPAILLLHGLGDEADTWRHIFPALSPEYRVIAPDLPGFGRSDQPARAYTIPFFQAVILELMDALSLPRGILVGHSMGAVIAHSIALQAPERVERLVLISGSLAIRSQRLNLGTLLFLVPGLGEWLYKRLRRDPQAAYHTLEPYYHHLKDLPEADRQFLFQRVNERVWSEGQRRAFLSTLRNLAALISGQQGRLAAQLAGLAVPTLVIWGREDRINPVENGQALLQVQPAARLKLLDGAGHNLHQERPEQTARTIIDFARGVNDQGT